MSDPVMTYHDFPDGELLVIDWLSRKGYRVSASLPANPTYPHITVARIGGGPLPGRSAEEFRIQLSVWAKDRASASITARQALTACWSLTETDKATVTTTTPEEGARWAPDESVTPPQPRFIATFSFIAHAI